MMLVIVMVLVRLVVIQLYGSMVIQKSDISSFHSDSCPKKLVLLSTWLALKEGKEKMKKLGLTEKELEQYYMENREKTQERMEKAVMNIQVMGETKTMDEVKKRVEDWESGPKVVEMKGRLYVEASVLGNQAESSSRSKEEVVDVDEVKEVKEGDGICLTVPEVPFQLTLSYQGAELLELINSTNFITLNPLVVDSFFIPLPCIFPFYLDNKLYNSCIFIQENQFRIPVFFCPVRNITTKIGGVNSFSSSSVRRLLYSGYCEEEERSEGDLLPPLTPDCSTCSLPRVAFSACTNNCPGGQSAEL